MCLQGIGLHAQNMIIFQSSIVTLIKGTYEHYGGTPVSHNAPVKP